jgi:hypothetical protein
MLFLYPLLGIATVAMLLLLTNIFKSILNRRRYQRQGISFCKTYPLIGSEVPITGLLQENKTRDYLYADAPNADADFVGSIRGFDIQLYAVNREATEELIHPSMIGVYIDRDTPALYSFGQLSPDALTFTPMRTEFFKDRKASILRSFDVQRMDRISQRVAGEYNDRYLNTKVLDLKRIATNWTREVTGEFVWGQRLMNESVWYKNRAGEREQVTFMLALNETFTRLRFYSNRFWNRVYLPMATWPITKDARLLKYNIRCLQTHLATKLKNLEAGTVSHSVLEANRELNIPLRLTRDDLLTISIAGLDTVQSTILASLWYLLLPENCKWKEAIVTSEEPEKDSIVEACVNEAIRLDPPGSVINNRVIKDLKIDVMGRQYFLRKGTRIMPNIHALHAKYGEAFLPGRFLDNQSKWDLYVMPFGKGRRSCPGQTIGMLMAKNFVKEFITKHPSAKIINGEDKHIRFNNISRSQLMLEVCEEKDKMAEAAVSRSVHREGAAM